MTGRSSVPFPVDSATLADVLPAASDFVLSTGMVSRRWVGHIDTIAHIHIFSSLFFPPPSFPFPFITYILRLLVACAYVLEYKWFPAH